MIRVDRPDKFMDAARAPDRRRLTSFTNARSRRANKFNPLLRRGSRRESRTGKTRYRAAVALRLTARSVRVQKTSTTARLALYC